MDNTQVDLYIQDNFHKISSLSEYINEITDFRVRILNEGKSETLYFRGQSDSSWDIRPSIFRNSLVSAESKIIQTAMARVPHEFKECSSSFEELTKLQHYGLPTRLLDVTMNPLVALYFACSSSKITKNEDGNDMCCDGIVYICQGYEEHEKSPKATILSSLAKMNITSGTTLRDLKERLDIKENYAPESFIDLIQDSIFVMPCYSNTRLIRQSGAFLITGAIKINIDENDIWNSKVSKCIRNLNEEIDKNHILISGDAKYSILDELDFVNINESTLFPELEHQMSHIKKVGSKWVTSDSDFFVKYEHQSKVDNISNVNSKKEVSDEMIQTILNKHIVVKEAKSEIKNIILNNIKFPDWDTKENIRNTLAMQIKRKLKSFGYTNAKDVANAVVNELINEIQ